MRTSHLHLVCSWILITLLNISSILPAAVISEGGWPVAASDKESELIIVFQPSLAPTDTRHMPTQEWFATNPTSSILVLDLDATIWVGAEDPDKKDTEGRTSGHILTTSEPYAFLDVPFYTEFFKVCKKHNIKVFFLSHGWHRRNLIEYYFEHIVKLPDIEWSVLGRNNHEVFRKAFDLESESFLIRRYGTVMPNKWKVMHILFEHFGSPMLFLDNNDDVLDDFLKAQEAGKCSKEIKSVWNKVGRDFAGSELHGIEHLINFLQFNKVSEEDYSTLLESCPFK